MLTGQMRENWEESGRMGEEWRDMVVGDREVVKWGEDGARMAECCEVIKLAISPLAAHTASSIDDGQDQC